jgi:hypothetical protein
MLNPTASSALHLSVSSFATQLTYLDPSLLVRLLSKTLSNSHHNVHGCCLLRRSLIVGIGAEQNGTFWEFLLRSDCLDEFLVQRVIGLAVIDLQVTAALCLLAVITLPAKVLSMLQELNSGNALTGRPRFLNMTWLSPKAKHNPGRQEE